MKKLDYIEFPNNSGSDREELILGLTDKKQKRLNPKYFYDELGSILFDKITMAEDYYPTKTEIEILENKDKKIKKELPSNSTIIEFGSGSNKKIKKLLNIVDSPNEYISIDISKDFLFKNSKELAKDFPDLKITAVSADFNQELNIPKIHNIKKPKIGFFPGSTIGNFSRIDAKQTLVKFRKILKPENFLVIGVDLKKDKKILEKAYNDKEGITAKFNKNIFKSLNSKFGTNFNEKNFEHNAFFNSKKSRIEMHLVTMIDHSVKIFDKKIDFKVGETIHTENSYKYTYKSFERLIESAGYRIQSFFSDDKSFFGVFILKVTR